MPVLRQLFQVSSDNAALQERLRVEANFVRSGDLDYQNIDMFEHSYDRTFWRAWMVSARNPTWKGIQGIVPAPLSRGGVAVQTGAATGAATPVVLPTDEGAVKARAFLDEHPYVERMAALIDAQTPARQRQMVLAAIGAVMNGQRGINLNLYANEHLRSLCERVWGYFPRGDDRYWRGIPGTEIDTLVRGGVGDAAKTWRRKAAGLWNASRTVARAGEVLGRDYYGLINFRDAVEPYAVVFGTPGGYDLNNYGCRSSSGGSVGLPTGCVAPTGEQHTLWFQGNGSLVGGAFPPVELDWRGWALASVQWGAPASLFEPIGGRYRLFAAPPLRAYWELFFWPQPEFADAAGRWRNFIEWSLALPASEVVRTTRAWVFARNVHQAEVASFASVKDLLGAAERRDNESQSDTARLISGISGAFGGVAEGLSRTGALSFAGLLVGGATAIGTALATTVARQTEGTDRWADVFGQMMPAFVQFNMLSSQAAVKDLLWRGVGWPDGVVPAGVNVSAQGGNYDLVTDAMVAAAELARFQGGYVQAVAIASASPGASAPLLLPGLPVLAAQYTELRIDLLPLGATVYLDASPMPLSGHWRDAPGQTWLAQVPRGLHTVRVEPPATLGPARTRTLDLQGPTTLRFDEMTSTGLQPITQGAPPAPAPVAPPSGSGRLAAGLLVTALLGGAGYAGYRNRKALLRTLGRR